MEKYVYIKLSIGKHFVDFKEPLDSRMYNNIGENYKDYLDNKWVLLSDEQVSFLKANKDASVKEVWDMRLRRRAAKDAKSKKQSSIKTH